MEIRKILPSEKANAPDLVWRVFLGFEAPDYGAEGVNTFRDFINNEEAINGLEIYGAYAIHPDEASKMSALMF